ncbi:MAG: DUF6065 family protein [Hyphomicrobiales bacterium]|nr:DUF6065 family protein [Hyphomicrobiales bacterium]
MELTCYVDGDDRGFEIRPAPGRRAWMDSAHERAPYRCTPLVIANGFGWELLSPVAFSAIWNGGQAKDGLVVLEEPGTVPPAHSHFGEGILTFRMPLVFRTDPGTDLIVQGPINRPKDAISPLTGIVESDWGPFSFTMNWKFTRARTAIHFAKGEPFCTIIPVERGALEKIHPRMVPLSAEPALKTSHAKWIAARNAFNEDLLIEGSQARESGWQKHYQRGVDPDGNRGPDSHRTKTTLRRFKRVPKEDF